MTNDPKNEDREGIHKDNWLKNGKNGTYFTNEGFGTYRAGNAVAKYPKGLQNNGITFQGINGSVNTFDIPSRFFPLSNATNYWRGTTSLLKKVDGNYIVLATFNWGFNASQGNIMTSSPLRFNSKGKPSELSFHLSGISAAK
jgi:hypothetical protein